MTRWTEDRIQELHEYKRQGLSHREIADLYGVTRNTIKKAWRRYRDADTLPPRPEFIENYRWPEDVGWREWCDHAERANQLEKRSDPVNQSLTINLRKTDRPVAICFAGDIHLGGGYTDHNLVRDSMEYLLETDDVYVSLCGDIFEGFLPSFRSAHAPAQMALSVKSQVNAYKSLLLELVAADKLIACSYGDHDAHWMESMLGYNPAKGAIHDSVPYFPGRGVIKLELGAETYYIVQNHREKNSSQWNRVHPSRRQYDKWFPGDVMVTAHTHSPAYMMDVQHPEARAAGLGMGGVVWYITTGTFKTGPDTYTIRGWRRGIFGTPTVLFWPDTHTTLCLPTPELAMAVVRGL